MRALVWHGARQMSIADVPEPHATEGEIVAQVVLAGICGSDLHAYRGNGGKRQPPLILGHEAVCRIAGNTRLYAVFPLAGCGHCQTCSEGHENLCPSRTLLGLDRPGVFAEYVALPARALVPVPDALPAEVAALAEPLATALGAIDVIATVRGKRVAVVGCGSIGLLTVFAAAHAGAEVIACDPIPERREAARRLGAASVLSSLEQVEAGSAPLVVDAVGAEQTIAQALATSAPGGTVSVVGLGQAEVDVAIGDVVRRGISLRGSYAYTREQFGNALNLLDAVVPPTDWLQQVPLAGGQSAFATLVDAPSRSIKVLLAPG